MFRALACLILLSFPALGLGCHTVSRDPLGAEGSEGDGSSADPPTAAASEIEVTLTQTSMNPVPVGLPTVLSIAATEKVQAGLSVEASWAARDGDPGREPRSGPATVELGPQGAELTVTLRGEDAPDSDEVLTLRGTVEGSRVQGTFMDRLIFPRAGLFEGTVR